MSGMSYGQNPIIPQNFPFKVEFAGLKGDTYALQKSGWQLAVDTCQDEHTDGFIFRVAGRHQKLNLQIVSGTVRLERHFFHSALQSNDMMRYFEHVVIPITFIAPKVDMVVYGKPNYGAVNFAEFGMRELDMKNIRRFSLEELCVFKTFGKETELYVPEKKIIDVQEYLKDILVSQEDKQREIRQRMLREGEKFNLKNELEEAPKLRLVGY